jgi:hypothetical protein
VSRPEACATVTDITPVVSFASPMPPSLSSRDVKLAWLVCPSDHAIDVLAFLALDLISERDAYRESLHAALMETHRLHAVVEQQRERRREAW